MNITKAKFDKFLGYTSTQEMYDALVQTLNKYDIKSNERIAAFIGQCAIESGMFKRLDENLNYSADRLRVVWPSLYNAVNAQQYANNPQKIANRSYAGKLGNGDEASGDGWKYRGRSVIQLTGKVGYAAAGKALGVDLLGNPDLAATYPYAMLIAGHYWQSRGLAAFADAGDLAELTRRVNAAKLGLAERVAATNKMLAILKS